MTKTSRNTAELAADDPQSVSGLLNAARSTLEGERDATWITLGGQTAAVIIPAQNYHEPGECCCKNCPWGGRHA